MAPGECHGGHVHESWHLLYVAAGGFEEAGDSGGFHVRAGTWRLSPAGLAHEIRCGEDGARCRNIHITDRALQSRLSHRLERRHHVLDGLDADPNDITSDPLLAELILYELVARAILACLGEDGPPAWLADARAEMISEPGRIDATARRFTVSREHFSRLYARHYGCSPRLTRRNAALAQALRLLRESDEPISEIAVMTGFYDQAHLTRAVTARLGQTPGAIRAVAVSGSRNSNTAVRASE